MLSTSITCSLTTLIGNERTMQFEGTGVSWSPRDVLHYASVCGWGERGRFSICHVSFLSVSKWFRWLHSKSQARQSLHSENTDIRHTEFRRRCSYAAISRSKGETIKWKSTKYKQRTWEKHAPSLRYSTTGYPGSVQNGSCPHREPNLFDDHSNIRARSSTRKYRSDSPILRIWPVHATPASLVRVKSSGTSTYPSCGDPPGVLTYNKYHATDIYHNSGRDVSGSNR